MTLIIRHTPCTMTAWKNHRCLARKTAWLKQTDLLRQKNSTYASKWPLSAKKRAKKFRSMSKLQCKVIRTKGSIGIRKGWMSLSCCAQRLRYWRQNKRGSNSLSKAAKSMTIRTWGRLLCQAWSPHASSSQRVIEPQRQRINHMKRER